MTEPTSAQDLFKGRHFDQEIIVLESVRKSGVKPLCALAPAFVVPARISDTNGGIRRPDPRCGLSSWSAAKDGGRARWLDPPTFSRSRAHWWKRKSAIRMPTRIRCSSSPTSAPFVPACCCITPDFLADSRLPVQFAPATVTLKVVLQL